MGVERSNVKGHAQNEPVFTLSARQLQVGVPVVVPDRGKIRPITGALGKC